MDSNKPTLSPEVNRKTSDAPPCGDGGRSYAATPLNVTASTPSPSPNDTATAMGEISRTRADAVSDTPSPISIRERVVEAMCQHDSNPTVSSSNRIMYLLLMETEGKRVADYWAAAYGWNITPLEATP